MDIIIAGAGRVGYRLAKTLSLKHNVTVIDRNANALGRLQEAIDIMPISGDIEDPDTYKILIEKSFDIFIAVTDSDEANILSTLIADDIIDVKRKIIRLRNRYFAKSSIAQKLRIDDAVFPFVSTALSIKSLLDFPKANNVKDFIFTDYKLVSVQVQNSDLSIDYLHLLNNKKLVVVGFEREKKFFIPKKNDRIKQKDLIYLFGETSTIKQLCSILDTETPKELNKVAIFGADILGVEIAKALLEKRVEIKVIEKDPFLCKRASEALQNRVMVINSKYIEHSLYEEENIKNADMIIATSNEDEENIIKCLEAKEYGVKKTVAINNNMELYYLMHKLGIVAVRGPKSNAYYSILEKIGSSSIITEKHYCGGRGTIFMRKIFPNSALIGKTIKPLKLEDLLSFYVRDGVIFDFSDKITLKEGDLIVIFLKSYLEEKIKDWIYNL